MLLITNDPYSLIIFFIIWALRAENEQRKAISYENILYLKATLRHNRRLVLATGPPSSFSFGPPRAKSLGIPDRSDPVSALSVAESWWYVPFFFFFPNAVTNSKKADYKQKLLGHQKQ